MTILRDLSVIWAMINIAVFFLIMMEFRVPPKRLVICTICYLIPLVTFDLWFLFTYGAARMAQSFFVIMLLPTVCFYFLLSKYRDGRFLYSFFLICDLNADMTILTYLLDLVLPGQRFVWMFALRLVLFPLLNYAAFRWLRRPYLRTQHSVEGGWTAFAVAAALFDYLVIRIFSYPNMIEHRPDDLPSLLLVITLTLLTNWYIFSALRNQQRIYEMREKEQLLRIQREELLRRMEQTSKIQNAISIERHDLRHRFHTLGTMLSDGRIDDAIAYVKASDERIASPELRQWCKNTVLNAVFSYYFSAAQGFGIRIEAELDLPDELQTDATDLSTVFANALENAIHATKGLPTENRWIKCRCIRFPTLMFKISNPYEGSLKWDDKGLPVPKDKPIGMGSRSIAAYCEKHGAWCDYKTRDGLFTIQITQP